MRKRLFWFLLVLLLPAVWAFVVEPRWVAQREIDHAVPNWRGPAGLKVAVASDWHFSRRPLWRVMTPERARAIVDEINAAKPDVILLPGDFLAEPDYVPEKAATPEAEIAAILGGLRAPLGVFAVLGNHEWWYHGPRFAEALRARLRSAAPGCPARAARPRSADRGTTSRGCPAPRTRPAARAGRPGWLRCRLRACRPSGACSPTRQ